MTLRQKLACVGLTVFGLQIASAAAGGAPLADRLRLWLDPEQLLAASVRMELGAPPVDVSPTPEAAAALSAATPAPEATPAPTSDGEPAEDAPTTTADGLPIVATSIAGGLSIKNETDIAVDAAALLQQGPAVTLPAGEPQILIMHTHASEAFTPAGRDLYPASDTCRTEDINYVRARGRRAGRHARGRRPAGAARPDDLRLPELHGLVQPLGRGRAGVPEPVPEPAHRH
ncbi:MAG: hypothetical protein ACLTG4_01310 [Oscillospiraceae bacterium]